MIPFCLLHHLAVSLDLKLPAKCQTVNNPLGRWGRNNGGGWQIPWVIFLGDNIYPEGLPQKNDPDRASKQIILEQQIKAAIAGDRKKSQPGGLEAVIRQQQFVDDYHYSIRDQP